MSVYVIGDLHLSFDSQKPMDIFSGWHNYVEKLEHNWKNKVKPEDTVVLAGDTSWGMSLEQSKKDFEFIENLPGNKVILKGNHDYWWTTKNKMEQFFQSNGLKSLKILHNNFVETENFSICGTRGWIFEKSENHDKRITLREASRLKLSIDSALDIGKDIIVFLHYPPVYANEISTDIIDILIKYKIKECYYGHIHGAGHNYAVDCKYMGINFHMISGDYIDFNPELVIY